MEQGELMSFFGWMAAINIGILALSTVLMISLRAPVYRLHAQLFGLQPEQIAPLTYTWLGQYKILIIVFNLCPYFALRLI